MMPTKLPLEILKFEGNPGDNPTNHVFSFHMWCSSNSITNGSIYFRLLQCTLIRAVMKWYVDQPRETRSTLISLATAFLSYFQLPLCYDTNTELLTSLHQSLATHLFDHVQEWHRRSSVC